MWSCNLSEAAALSWASSKHSTSRELVRELTIVRPSHCCLTSAERQEEHRVIWHTWCALALRNCGHELRALGDSRADGLGELLIVLASMCIRSVDRVRQ